MGNKKNEGCWACREYPNDIRFLIQIKTFTAKTARETDVWSLILGIEYRFCLICGKKLHA